MKKNTIIFDLDGTLLDTLEDIAISTNLVLEKFGKTPIPVQDYRYLVGEGALKLMQDILPDAREKEIKEALALYEKIYALRYDENTKLYDGISKLLTFLQKRGFKMAILSNKPNSFTKLCVIKYLKNWNFDAVYGIREGIPRKPSSAGVEEILKELQVKPQDCLFIGDTKIDMLTAKSADIDSIGVLWGFRDKEELVDNGARYIAAHPKDVMRLVAEL
ncbi:MAG: HAD family hydrolase [Epsilonproteobacteria bacterium]|nr:HAD family hydrolase [Campylobacterota bacterium]